MTDNAAACCVCVCVCLCVCVCVTNVIACRHSPNAAPLEQTKLILTHIRADTGLGCLHTTQLPDITYVLKEGSYTLTAEDYVVFGEGYMQGYGPIPFSPEVSGEESDEDNEADVGGE